MSINLRRDWMWYVLGIGIIVFIIWLWRSGFVSCALGNLKQKFGSISTTGPAASGTNAGSSTPASAATCNICHDAELGAP